MKQPNNDLLSTHKIDGQLGLMANWENSLLSICLLINGQLAKSNFWPKLLIIWPNHFVKKLRKKDEKKKKKKALGKKDVAN
jgi:hypothetical protein